jgi:transposase-like protein
MTPTTDLTTVPTKILKTDCKGRIHFPMEMREELLDCFERSGMSGAEFARHYDIKYSTFAYWRQKRDRQKRKAEGEPDETGFVELALPADPPESGHLEMTLPGGASLKIMNREDARLAAELLKVLGETGC